MELVIALVGFAGVVVGAVFTTALQHSFWKRQHREELRSLKEREKELEAILAALRAYD